MYEIIGEFTKRLKTTKDYSKSTIENYSRTIISFDDYLRINSHGEKRVIYPEKIGLIDINQFISQNKANGKKLTTTNNYLAWIKMFLIFCKNKWLSVLDENKLIFTNEPINNNVETLTTNDTILFLSQLKNDTNKPKALRIRDYAIGLMLTYWWLRVQELCDLKINDIWKDTQISVKWDKKRTIQFKEEYMKVIKHYISLRNSLWINSEYVFISHSNNSLWNKLSRASVEEIIRKAWEKAWIWKVWPHKLRHTYAAQMLNSGEDTKSISKNLWYKNKQAAQRYFNHKISKLNNTN